ncbi:Ankyrin repeat domain-containing protein 26 [Manis javanica]|nr:Ankyrin repeat domain-containing protein 26 [Manis javanica]
MAVRTLLVSLSVMCPVDILTSENTMLRCKLQNEKASKERLETEVVSDNSRLSTATHVHEQSQASERELGPAFHSRRARNELFCFLDKMNFDMSNLEENMSILSRQLSKAEATSYYTNEIQDLKKKLNQALSQAVDLSRKLEVSSSEVRNLKTHMARISLEMEQYRWDTEERARQRTEKLKEVDWFLQDESQKRLQQWREKDNSSFRMQMELRIKDLEFQLSKKISQEDSIKAELEKYKQLHQEEVNTSLSLANQLDKITERLAEINSKRREKEMDTFFAKMEQEFHKSITRAQKEDAAKFEFESSIAAPLGSMDGLTPTQALLLKMSQEYAQILRKNYMI